MQRHPTRLTPAAASRRIRTTAPRPRPELLGNPDPGFAESARRAGLSRPSLYHWFRPTFPGHVVVKALLSNPSLTVPEVARRLWVDPRTVRAWFPLPVRARLVRFLLTHGGLSLSQVARRLGDVPKALDAWLPPEERFRLAREILANPDPTFAESARRAGLSRRSLYNWFRPTFPSHVVVKALLSRPTLTVPEVARRLWVEPRTVRAWFPLPVRARLVRFLLTHGRLSLSQVARRWGLPIEELRECLSARDRFWVARFLLIHGGLSLPQLMRRLRCYPLRSLYLSWLPPQQRFRVLKALLVHSDLSPSQLARRLDIPLDALDTRWLTPRYRFQLALVLITRTDLSLSQVARRLDVSDRILVLQWLAPQCRVRLARALLRHTDLSLPRIARRLDVSIDTFSHWFPSLNTNGDAMTPPSHKPRLIGYARVSTLDQDPHHQTRALKAAGCSRVFADKISGSTIKRPQLRRALNTLRRGDTLVAWSIDRLGRSLPHLLQVVSELEERGVALRFLLQDIDTTTPMGQMVLHVFAALGQFERDLIAERTQLAADRRQQTGQVWGRPSRFHDPEYVALAKRLLKSGLPKRQVANKLGITLHTLYRWFPGGKAENFGKGDRGANLPPELTPSGGGVFAVE